MPRHVRCPFYKHAGPASEQKPSAVINGAVIRPWGRGRTLACIQFVGPNQALIARTNFIISSDHAKAVVASSREKGVRCAGLNRLPSDSRTAGQGFPSV